MTVGELRELISDLEEHVELEVKTDESEDTFQIVGLKTYETVNSLYAWLVIE